MLVGARRPRHESMDKLDEIFDLQDALNKRIGVNTDNMSDEEKAKWVLNYTRAMQQETAELIAEKNNRPIATIFNKISGWISSFKFSKKRPKRLPASMVP